jgi:hypothetical protein
MNGPGAPGVDDGHGAVAATNGRNVEARVVRIIGALRREPSDDIRTHVLGGA